MFSVSNISVYYPGQELLSAVSFNINAKDRLGLVGRNGSGKTTLLNIIAGLKKPDTGSVSIPTEKTLGYLKQEMDFELQHTVFERAMTAFSEINQLEADINRINALLIKFDDHNSNEYLRLINSLHDKHERLNYLEAANRDSHVEKILKGLGFKTSDFNRKIAELSGGWQMRVELTKILLLKPDLILLDEPTNHLDIESILWFEDYLRNYPGAVVLISHDKQFLDNICNRTIEIINGKIYDYKLNYSRFLELREERLETQKNAAKNQQRFIEQQERFIERFRAKNTKAKQVRSKLKKLEKIEKIEFDEVDTSSLSFRFSKAPQSGTIVFEGKNISKFYDSLCVFKDIDFEVERGESIAFVGKNGEGKTTFVKVLMKLLSHEGQLKQGYNTSIGYYAQIQENSFDDELTVLETISMQASGEWSNITRIRTLLGVFLFSEDDVDKKVKVLSGGEKSRLALAQLLLKPYNVLILDEPTNHLDIPSKEILKNALKEFSGTIILVSHDRDFLKGLTTKTYEFTNRKVKIYPGSIEDFLAVHQVDTFRDFELGLSQKAVKTQKTGLVNSEQKINYSERKEAEKDQRKLKNAISKLESKIEQIDKLLKELEKKMQEADFYKDMAFAKSTIEGYEKLKNENNLLMEEWEKLSFQE